MKLLCSALWLDDTARLPFLHEYMPDHSAHLVLLPYIHHIALSTLVPDEFLRLNRSVCAQDTVKVKPLSNACYAVQIRPRLLTPYWENQLVNSQRFVSSFKSITSYISQNNAFGLFFLRFLDGPGIQYGTVVRQYGIAHMLRTRLAFDRTHRIASSKTLFKLRWVSAEHSRYL